MKTDNKTWQAYLASWPDDWYYEDAEEFVNGEKVSDIPDDLPDDAVIRIEGGCIYDGEDGRDLVRHFGAWKRKQTTVRLIVEVDVTKADALKAAIKAAGGSVA